MSVIDRAARSVAQWIANDGQDCGAPQRRIAIVGCGPRGLWALQELTLAFQELGVTDVAVDIYEPHRFPGAGAVYDPRQPAFLRMNFASRYIDARRLGDAQSFPYDFVSWARVTAAGAGGDPDEFAPRRTVGRYLYDVFQQAFQRASQRFPLLLIAEKALWIERSDAGWVVRASSQRRTYDEVLLTTGHGVQQRIDSSSTAGQASARAFSPYELLDEERIRPGTCIAIRGMGLTGIDATLALTEGRGGRFESRGGKLVYKASGREPRKIVCFSRSGAPMLAKPLHLDRGLAERLRGVWERSQKSIRSLPITSAWADSAFMEVLNASDAALKLANSSPTTPNSATFWTTWLARRWDGSAIMSALSNSVAENSGMARRGPAWALGEAWRHAYPALVDAISYGKMEPAAFARFQTIARAMERIAFGPPVCTAARMLALHEAGKLSWEFARSPQVVYRAERWNLAKGGKHLAVDEVIHAVIDGPGRPCAHGAVADLAHD
ncbi:MAG: FAD/NAD(P)-binding protein, partial [Planctomycetales bacterium]|nr:FAD/NAD(P)-binding protein [Planctomycetales bacterium]